MALNNVKDYLLSLNIPRDDKRYVLNFCKKIEYLESLRKQAASETQERIELGYGDANSKICFIFQSKAEFSTVKAAIQKQLDDFNLNLWQIWVTFVDKTPSEYNKKYEFLAHEMNAINPTAIYFFGNSQEPAAHAEECIRKLGCPNMKHFFFIENSILLQGGDDIKQILWPQFRFLINYQTLDVQE